MYLLERRLLLWRRAGKEVEGDRIWANLRLFSGWACAGCVAGSFAFSFLMQGRNFDNECANPAIVPRRFYELQASANRLYAAFNMFYPISLLSVIYAMNLLLRRVSDHASHSYYNVVRDQEAGRTTRDGRFDLRDCIGQYALYNLVRFMHKIAMVLCALNAVVCVPAAGFRVRTAVYYEQAAAATDSEGGETSASQNSSADAAIQFKNCIICLAVSRIFEAVVLLLEFSAFLLFFPACIVMFRRVERRLDAIIQEMDLRSDVGNVFLPFEFSPPAADGCQTQTELPIVEAREFLQTIKSSATAQRRRFVFCLLLLLLSLAALTSHAVFVTYFTLNAGGVKTFETCPPCGSCQPVGWLIGVWYVYTPELIALVVSLGSALPLLFSLWLMTTPEDRALLMRPDNFRTDAIGLQQTAEIGREARLRAERVRMGIDLQ